MNFRDQSTRIGRQARTARAVERHMRWREMCLEAIEDHRDLEGFAPLHDLTKIGSAVVADAFMKGTVERGLLRRAAYHELRALYMLRQTGAGGRDRARVAALREFLGLGCPDDEAAASEIAPDLGEISAADDKPPGRHPPPSSGRPRVKRVTRTRTTGSRCDGHGSSWPRAAAIPKPLATR